MGMMILAVVALLIVAFLGYVTTRPSELRVERKARMRAAPGRIFGELNDFRKWTGWSPWEKMDPALTREYLGAREGKGAAYAWKGNAKVGEGKMEILESTPPVTLRIQLDFIKPFRSRNLTTFTLMPDGEFTELTWAMRGPATFMTKLMGVFMDFDKAIGKDFEQGLANLRGVVEDGAGS